LNQVQAITLSVLPGRSTTFRSNGGEVRRLGPYPRK